MVKWKSSSKKVPQRTAMDHNVDNWLTTRLVACRKNDTRLASYDKPGIHQQQAVWWCVTCRQSVKNDPTPRLAVRAILFTLLVTLYGFAFVSTAIWPSRMSRQKSWHWFQYIVWTVISKILLKGAALGWFEKQLAFRSFEPFIKLFSEWFNRSMKIALHTYTRCSSCIVLDAMTFWTSSFIA